VQALRYQQQCGIAAEEAGQKVKIGNIALRVFLNQVSRHDFPLQDAEMMEEMKVDGSELSVSLLPRIFAFVQGD